MEDELNIKEKNKEAIDSQELLIRFNLDCNKKAQNSELKSLALYSSDIVSAVHYFRKYPDVGEFIERFLKNNKEYFQIQWVRSTWNKLSQMSQEELSEVVINQINFVAKQEEEY